LEVIQTLTVHSVTPGKDILEGERPWEICLQVIWVERILGSRPREKLS